MEVFAKWGINSVSDSGVLIVGEKGAFYSSDDYCGKYELKGVEKVKVDYEKAEDKGNNDLNNMWELFRAKLANDPKICKSNFIDRAGPLTETICWATWLCGPLLRAEPTARWANGARRSNGTSRTWLSPTWPR